MTDFSLNLTSQRKPEAIADGYPVSAIFPDVSIRSHRLWRPRGIPLPSPGPSRERRRNPRSSQARIVPSSELSGESCALQRRNSLAFPHCDEPASRGGDPVWWGNQTGTGATPESVWKWRVSGWLGFVRELGPGQRHLVQDTAVALALDLFGQAPAFLGKATILCGRGRVWRHPDRQLTRSGCMRVMPRGTAIPGPDLQHQVGWKSVRRSGGDCCADPNGPDANNSAAPADSGFHPGTRTPRC